VAIVASVKIRKESHFVACTLASMAAALTVIKVVFKRSTNEALSAVYFSVYSMFPDSNKKWNGSISEAVSFHM
jgi:hypothetical protein